MLVEEKRSNRVRKALSWVVLNMNVIAGFFFSLRVGTVN